MVCLFLYFSISMTLFLLLDFLIPISSIQLQSSGQGLAAGGSEDKLEMHLRPGFPVWHCVRMQEFASQGTLLTSPTETYTPLIIKGQTFKTWMYLDCLRNMYVLCHSVYSLTIRTKLQARNLLDYMSCARHGQVARFWDRFIFPASKVFVF